MYYKNKNNGTLAIVKSLDGDGVSAGSGELIAIGENGEEWTIDMEDWEQIPAQKFMQEIGLLRARFEVAKKIVEENVPSRKIMG